MTLQDVRTPQLQHLHSGKVRESFRVDADTRLIVTTDRVSAFDRVLNTAIPDKGAVLNGLSEFWFQHTAAIVENHFIRSVDAQASLVQEVTPIRVEMIVRGYLTGSMWRQYMQGKRDFSGLRVPDGLTQHARFATPILTPTTKEQSDREITPFEIVASGLVSQRLYEEMEAAALRLFSAGTDFLAHKGLLLVDTKYEFGVHDDQLILIDELHTPDSSRFWLAESYEADPANPHNLDKEYIRSYLLERRASGMIPDSLPDAVVSEASTRYRTVFELITGTAIPRDGHPVQERLYRNLVRQGIIKDGYVAVIMGSPKDMNHAQKIAAVLDEHGVFVDLRVVSAHKNPEDIPSVLSDYSRAMEPGALIAVAGLSNGLGGALAGSTCLPVLSCPPFGDQIDLMLNINSSLMMPSGVPVGTVVNPASAALAALRSLNLPRLKHAFLSDIESAKAALRTADTQARRRSTGS